PPNCKTGVTQPKPHASKICQGLWLPRRYKRQKRAETQGADDSPHPCLAHGALHSQSGTERLFLRSASPTTFAKYRGPAYVKQREIKG
ncbi:hypothetical protein N9I33_00835, partial [Paracoccaceae bacterium]|nr:hypothetical protein [Paracoccaceae bacterium]